MGRENTNNDGSGSDSGSASASDDSSNGSHSNGSHSSGSGSDAKSGSGSSRSRSSSSASSNSSRSDNDDATQADGATAEQSANGLVANDDDDDDSMSPPKKKSIKDVTKSAAEQPDLYGIRRSGRQRKEVMRYTTANSDSDEKPNKRSASSRRKRRGSGSESGDKSSSASEFSDGFRPMGRRRIARPGAAASRRAIRRPPPKPAASNKRGGAQSSEDDYSDSDDDGQPSRASSRRVTSQKVSYKEESEAATESDELIEMEQTAVAVETNDAETVEHILQSRLGLVGATGSMTAFYNVRDHGDPNKEGEPRELQYLVKWKNWAHIHNTWETEQGLVEQKVNGLKRLDTFKKKQQQIQEWRECVSREDIDYYDCQKEMQNQLQREYYKVERICSHASGKTASATPAGTADSPDGPAQGDKQWPDYLTKWKCLPYSECTWEDGQLMARLYQPVIDAYHKRQKSSHIPNKYCKVLKTRPKFTTIKLQPENLGNSEYQLRDYQMEGLNWLVHSWCKSNGVILADEMGLGKTIQMISFLNVLSTSFQLYGPFLLVVPLSTIVTWHQEFHTWAPHLNCVVYLGDINSRNKIREFEWCHIGNKRLKFNVLITTYEIVLKDRSFLSTVGWAVLGVDEAHRLKNEDSLLYQTLMTFDTNHRILITGTPLQNSLKELWSLVHFIMPDRFHSWSEFEERHSTEDRHGFQKLHKELEPFLLRRMKKDVEKSLPAKVEQILRVEMAKTQKQYYKWILTKNYKALSKGLKGNTASFMNLVMELKKCCNHSFLVRPPEQDAEETKDPFELLVKGSGKLILLDKLLMKLRESDHRVLIFSQMVRMLDILAEYLQYRRFPFQRLDGSISSEQRKQAMDHFNAEGSEDFCFLLSTRAGGLGVNLATADIVIIYDSDWNPQNDLQAQARAHRIGQKKQVSVYRLVTKGSVEEDIIERAKKKMVLDHLVIQRMDTTGRTVLNRTGLGSSSNNNPFKKEELNAILKFGAEELFKETEEDEQDIQVDIDDILKRAETRNTEDNSSASDELLSQFKVVSFENMEDEELEGRKAISKDWDEIIPEVDRKQMDEEEMNRHLMELNLPPRSRKKVTQMNLFDSDDEDDKKKRHRGAKAGEDYSESSDDSDEGGDAAEKGSKKRGRPKGGRRQAVPGFTGADIRRFVRSYKRFGRPHERLDAIAGDAELQEKSKADLKRLAELLHSSCQTAMAEYEQKLLSDPNFDGKKTHRGPTFKLANVTVNAKSVLQAINDLEPLAAAMPQDRDAFAKYELTAHVKSAHFDCPWEVEEDSNLLKGIHEYGMGNWEPIKMDPALNLYDKILPDSQLKPQSKHLQTRADYLMKVLRKQQGGDTVCNGPNTAASQAAKRGRGKRNEARVNPRIKSKEIIDDTDDDSGPSEARDEKENCEKGAESPKTKKARASKEDGGQKKGDKKKKKKKDKPKKAGPMHFTTNKTVSILPKTGDAATDDDLPPDVFSVCKEKMRPMKKALNQLGKPEPGLADREQLNHTRRCLLKIGSHIDSCLAQDWPDTEAAKLWRSHLWIFVAKFTEFDAARLYKLYRHAMKAKETKAGVQPADGKATKHHHHHHHHHQHSGARDTPRGRPEGKTKKGVADLHSDNSHDSLQNSSHNSSHPPPPSDMRSAACREVGKEAVDVRWQQTSPLAREDMRKNKYNDVPNSYNRFPSGYSESTRGFRHDDRHHSRYKNESWEHGYDNYYRGADAGAVGGGGGGSYNSRYDTPPSSHYHRNDYWNHRQDFRGGKAPPGGHDRFDRKRRRNDYADYPDRDYADRSRQFLAKEAKQSQPEMTAELAYPKHTPTPSGPLDPRDPRCKH